MTNARAARPGRKIKLEGQDYHLILDMNAFCLLEERVEKMTGNRNIFTAIDWQNLNLRDFSLVIWAGLMTEHPELELTDVRRMVTLPKFQELRPIIDEMLVEAMPQPEPRKEGEVEEKKTTTETKTA